jgi:DNA-binding MarR family transcriptional regulator
MTGRGLRGEIQQGRPFATAEVEVFLNVVRTADHLQGEVQRWLKVHGLSLAQYNVLRILRGAGRTGLSGRELAARMVARVPDVTRLVDRLQARGLARRRRDRRDRRVVRITSTTRGDRLASDLEHPLLEVHRRQLGHLTPAELSALNELLVRARSDA